MPSGDTSGGSYAVTRSVAGALGLVSDRQGVANRTCGYSQAAAAVPPAIASTIASLTSLRDRECYLGVRAGDRLVRRRAPGLATAAIAEGRRVRRARSAVPTSPSVQSGS